MADVNANGAWVKCTDGVWRLPGDYPGQQLPVPPLPVPRRIPGGDGDDC